MNYRRRRGLSGGTMVDGVYVMDTPITTETVYASGAPSVFTDSSGVPLPVQSQSLTQWLNANSTMVMVGAALLVGLVFVGKAVR